MTSLFGRLRWLSLLAFVLFFGCGPVLDPVAERAKTILLKADLSASAVSIEQAIAMVPQGQPIVLKAKVGSGKGDTFDPNTCEFLVSEIPAGEHASDEKHDSDNCPFCRAREAKAPTVVVRLLDPDGKPFSRPADQLFGLKKGQHVLVQGVGSYDAELNFYTFEARGLKISE